MKQIILALLMCASAHATNVLYYYGKIDSVSVGNPLMKVGDAAYFRIEYNPGNNVVTEATAYVNESALNLLRSATTVTVYIDQDPTDGIVQWSVGIQNGSNFRVDAATNTPPGGPIPCIDDYNLGRTFQIFFNNIIANGTITAAPRVKTGQ